MNNIASIHFLGAEDPARAEAIAWARFSVAKDGPEFCSSWLAILCGQIERVGAAMVLLGPDSDGAYAPAAMWPNESRDLHYLSATAERALNERRGIVVGADGESAPARDQNAFVGYPVEVAGVLHGAVVLDLSQGGEREVQQALRALHWASAWLVDQFRRRATAERDRRHERLSLVTDVVATAFGERRLAASAVAVVNELADRMRCDRVSIGLDRGRRIEVIAVSHTAIFNARMSLVRRIGDAMEEALDLDAAVAYPPASGDEQGALAHAELASEFKDIAICSVPLLDDGQAIGIITLERGSGVAFDPESVALCRMAGTLLGPVLALKADGERGAWRRLRDAAHGGAVALFGPRHPGVKLIAGLAVAVVVVFSVAGATYRVSGKAFLEGAVQRAAVAPFDGHVAETNVRAGDTVKAGQLLLRLDDRELYLDRTKLSSEREQAVRKQRQALATQDRSAMVLGAAQISQLDAQIALMDDKLARVSLLAPFDGIVVSGDLSQMLGAPVEQGRLLFQVAPLDDYRIVVQVDERDVTDLAIGQVGELSLSGLPYQHLGFTVRQITPVSTTQDGRNFFRVEGGLTSPPARLRPGMEGVGKIAVGERKLIWIWTHSLFDWLSNWMWREWL